MLVYDSYNNESNKKKDIKYCTEVYSKSEA